ncbi:MAG: hypothetical protein JXA90_13955 [Planctomycetes bacterium]|nr:hypothetical protein [Planctomycetota bacterium]
MPVVAISGCIVPPPLPTVAGPEADLIGRLRGCIVTQGRLESGSLSTIRVVSIPSLAKRVITPSMPYRITCVKSLSGPDSAGRIAFVQDEPAADRFNLVKIIHLDGTGEREITRIPAGTPAGIHPWRDPGMGRYICLSPVAGRLAFIRDLRGRQMPRVFCQVGTLETWDVEAASKLRVVGPAVDWGLSWFPDGRRIAYIALHPRHRVPLPAPGDTFGASGSRKLECWDEVPAVVVLDVETGETTIAGLGLFPVVSSDGMKILVRDLEGTTRAIDISTGRYSKIEPPGICGPVIAYLHDDLLVYQSRPTEGQPVRRSWAGSFRSGIQMLPIKVCDLSTGGFQTIMEAVDPRHAVSFGTAP